MAAKYAIPASGDNVVPEDGKFIAEPFERGFGAAVQSNSPGHTFVVLEVEPFGDAEQKLEQPPFDGPELKFRFGRAVEQLAGVEVFGYRV